jgi:hypothetical protein
MSAYRYTSTGRNSWKESRGAPRHYSLPMAKDTPTWRQVAGWGALMLAIGVIGMIACVSA